MGKLSGSGRGTSVGQIECKERENHQEFVDDLMDDDDDGQCMIIVRLSILIFEISGSARDVTALLLINIDLIKNEYRFLHRYIMERTE